MHQTKSFTVHFVRTFDIYFFLFELTIKKKKNNIEIEQNLDENKIKKKKQTNENENDQCKLHLFEMRNKPMQRKQRDITMQKQNEKSKKNHS